MNEALPTLYIFGAGGFGREVLDLARLVNADTPRWEHFSFVVDSSESSEQCGIPVISFKQAIESERDAEFIIALGEPKYRLSTALRLKGKCRLAEAIVHPTAQVSPTASIAPGTIIQMGCFVSSNAIINENCVLQPYVLLGHDSTVGKNSVLSGFSNIAGHCNIGDSCFLALSSVVREQVSIGQNTVLSAGAVALKDVPDNVIASGNPARGILKNESHLVFS